MKVEGRLGSWPGTPRGLLAAFLGLTLGPALALLWAGWRMVEKDRAGLAQSILWWIPAGRSTACSRSERLTVRRRLSGRKTLLPR